MMVLMFPLISDVRNHKDVRASTSGTKLAVRINSVSKVCVRFASLFNHHVHKTEVSMHKSYHSFLYTTGNKYR